MSTGQHFPGLIALVATVISVASAATASARELANCSAATGVGTACMCTIPSLHPTQLAVGMNEVDKRVHKIKKMSQGELGKYEQCRPVPLVIGPPTGAVQFYLTDHHHLARALLDAGENSTRCIIADSRQTLSDTDFRDWMVKNKKVWLFDEKGNPITFEQLPGGLKELRDDRIARSPGRLRSRMGFTSLVRISGNSPGPTFSARMEPKARSARQSRPPTRLKPI
jgi:hypothetical protein